MAKEYVEERNGGYLAGTRVSLDSIVQCFDEGLSPEAILGEFETLTLAQVFGAIAYYLETQPAIDSYRMRQMQRFEAVRHSANPLPPGLRQRLDSARQRIHSTHSSGSHLTHLSGLIKSFGCRFRMSLPAKICP